MRECQPDFKTAGAAWILAGGAHHTGYSYSVTREMLEDLATIAGIELAVIDADTRLADFKQKPPQQRGVLPRIARRGRGINPRPPATRLPQNPPRLVSGLLRAARWSLLLPMLAELKREAYEANLALPARGLINLTFGNASAIDRARGIFAIKPSGVDYAALKPGDMVLVDLEGRKVEGRLNPSSDTPTHRRLFLSFPRIGGVVHTHSTRATAFAQAGRPIPCLGTTHADCFFGEVPVTRPLTADEIARDYEWETGNGIVERFRADRPAPAGPLECPAILVNRHAPFTWGDTVAHAVETAVALECCAQMAALSLQLAPSLTAIGAELLDMHFHRKHGPRATYGQS